MRSKTAIVIVLLLQCIIVSQTLDHSVRRIAPRPTSRDISYITKLNDGRIVAAMNPTGLIYSSDDGLTWTEDLTLRTSNPPSNIVYLSEETFAGTSTKGEFFITHDGGLSFTVKSLLSGALPTFTFSKIGFANEGVSIAIYYAETAKYLLKTTDGWQTQSNIVAPPEYFGGDMFIFIDSSIVVSSRYCIYRSSDLGNSWIPVYYSKQGNFLDHGNGKISFFSSSDSVFTSSDRGVSWEYRANSPKNLKSSQAVLLKNGDVYVSNMRFDTLYRATDELSNWTMVKNLGTYLKGSPRGFLTITDTLAFLVGDYGYIYRYSGAELNRSMISEAYLPSSNAWFADTLHAITARGNQTSDGGKTWRDGFAWPPIGAPDVGSYLSLSKTGLGVIAFNSYNYFPPNPSPVDYTAILITTDHGVTWGVREENYSHLTYDVTAMGDSLIIFALIRTQMGWNYYLGLVFKDPSGYYYRTNTLPAKVIDLAAINSRKMILAATSDSLMASYDSAKTWRTILKPGGSPGFQEVIANEAGTIIVRRSGNLYISTNFGSSWSTTLYNFAGAGVYALSPNGLLAFSSNNIVKYQHRNTTTWKSINYDFIENVQNLQFVDESTLMVQTGRAGYYRIDISDTVTTSVEEKSPVQQPGSFTLYQNYPNPFNPETVIRFALPEAGFVKGVVYDILGREVKTLLNGEMNSGNHEVKFDAMGFASGIYVFRLEAGKYSSAIKMVVGK
jgi:photosystem II stability/assembly factor-like uncharacterized protein